MKFFPTKFRFISEIEPAKLANLVIFNLICKQIYLFHYFHDNLMAMYDPIITPKLNLRVPLTECVSEVEGD